MPSTQSTQDLRTKAQTLLDRLVIPGTMPESVAELLDAIVTDMRSESVQAATEARELVAAEDRLSKIENQVRVLTAALLTMANSVASSVAPANSATTPN